MDPYSGGHTHGSGSTAGAGFGNKMNIADEEDLKKQHSETRLDVKAVDKPQTGYGGASMGGAGYGNKVQDANEREGDGGSSKGKIMEKLESLFKK